ncbi:substrate-binding domain-containing protein, partial [Acinetobacter baumannii]
QAQLARLNLVVKPFGVEAIAVVAHPANPVAGLTMEQLRQILAGEATTWDAFGGPKQPIVIILPPPSDAVINFIKAAVITSGSL